MKGAAAGIGCGTLPSLAEALFKGARHSSPSFEQQPPFRIDLPLS